MTFLSWAAAHLMYGLGGWDMSGQSNDCLWVCNVKMKKFLLGQKRGTFPRIFGFWGHSINQFENFFMGFGVPISLTVVDISWLISTRSRWGTWVHTWSIYHCTYLG